MSDENYPPVDRLTELLADRALFGLDEAEQRELDALLVDAGEVDAESLDRTAAAAQLAVLGTVEKLPEGLAQKLTAQGLEGVKNRAPVENNASVSLPSEPMTFRRRELWAWLSAAAAVLVAFFVANQPEEQVLPQALAALRAELLSLAETDPNAVTQVAWSRGEDAAGEAASGEVVWHNGRQQGVMRFKNLAVNDPTESQYQLWIFDAEQDASYPIDGGVFDVAGGADEVFVAIDAKLNVVKPTMFAITVEKPGGVVVSSRERLPLLAKVE